MKSPPEVDFSKLRNGVGSCLRGVWDWFGVGLGVVLAPEGALGVV